MNNKFGAFTTVLMHKKYFFTLKISQIYAIN